MNVYHLDLDFDKRSALSNETGSLCVVIRQGDTSGTQLSVDFYDHGTPFTGSATVYFAMELPDKSHYYRTQATYSNGTATVTLDEAYAASVVGRTGNAYFELHMGSGIASTQTFTVVVLPSATLNKAEGQNYDDEIVATIRKWLDAHPEATTTVEDGSIDAIKLAHDLKVDLETYCGLSYGESLEIVTGEYVDGGGTIASSGNFNRTRAFKVYKNVPLTMKATGYSTGVSMIATCLDDESDVKSRVRSIDSSEHEYSYTPTEDGYAIVSFKNTAPYEITFGMDASGLHLKEAMSTISDQVGYPDDLLQLFEHGYIDRNGTKQSSTSFDIYGFLDVGAGDMVEVTVRGYTTSVAVIFETNSDHETFVPLVMCVDGTTRTYTYTASESMTIGICSHVDTPPTWNVTRMSIFDRLAELESSTGNPVTPILAFGSITCIGDSLTWSQVFTGSSSSRQAYNPYPKVIEHLTGVPTSYVARPGASASSLWQSSSDDVIARDGQLTIIYLGTNNGLTDSIDTDMVGSDYTTWADTNTGCYGKFIAKSISVGSRVVLVKVHSSSGDVDTTNTVIEKMGQRFGIPVLENAYLSGDIYHNWPNGQGRNGTHYNDFGYAQFAKNIIDEINAISTSILLDMIPM